MLGKDSLELARNIQKQLLVTSEQHSLCLPGLEII